MKTCFRFGNYQALTILLATAAASITHAATGRVLDPKFHHLGNDIVKTWPEAPSEPAGFKWELKFEAKANGKEMTLALTHRDIHDRWAIQINDKKIGELTQTRERKLHYYSVPPGALKDGENTLLISIIRGQDDITIGGATLHDGTLRDVFKLRPVTVAVVDEGTGRHLPARITIADKTNSLAEIYYAATPRTAVRRGVLYTYGEPTQLELPAGDYDVYATHGTEWSMAHQTLLVTANSSPALQLALRRELETPGFVAADTHIHTLTFSGHGDASAEERMLTLAAEGVELAIATDHNHQTDFKPFQAKMKLNDYFTSVTGNEVTTKNGHFNSFPLPPGKNIPPYDETDWVKLVDGIRAKGAKVVILNHPRWPDIPRGPFGRFGLNRASGERASGSAFTFDALELINSGTLQPDPLYICRDWFALLNHGEKITAVGSSDSHTVGNIVGQGRTYVRSSTDVPAHINVDEACTAFLAGDTTVSLGIIADVKVNDRYRMGHQIKLTGKPLDVNLRVTAPSWVTPRRAIVYLNGSAVSEQAVPISAKGRPTNSKLRFKIPAPIHDSWLVCVILGDGVKCPAWKTEENYTFAATNPIYLDADADGNYRSPGETAAAILERTKNDANKIWKEIMVADDAIAIQLLSQTRLRNNTQQRAELDRRVKEAATTRNIFAEYLRYLPSK